MKYLNLVLFIVMLLTGACTNDLELRKASLSDYDDFDTIAVAKDHNIYILYGLRHTDMDLQTYSQSSMTMLFVKHTANNGLVAYKMYKNEAADVSKDYVAITKGNYGWSYIKDETVIDVIPNTQYVDSRHQHAEDKDDVIVQDTFGYILINGKQVRALKDGRFTPIKDKYFDSLAYKLYRLQGDSLVVASNNADDISKQKHGVYFVPPPGYGIIKMYSKEQILNAIDSASKLPEQPYSLYIKALYHN